MKKVFLFAVMAVFLVACKTNNPENGVQTFSKDNLTFSYYLSDMDGNIKNLFTQNEWLIIHLNIQNNSADTLMINASDLGTCFDSQSHSVEKMSTYIYNDTIPAYKATILGETSHFTYAFYTSISSGAYYYQNPQVLIFHPSKETEKKEYIIPLTINFKIQ